MKLKNGQSFPCLGGYMVYEVLYTRRIYTQPTQAAEAKTETLWGSGSKPTGDRCGTLVRGTVRRDGGSGHYAPSLFSWATRPNHPSTLSGHITGKLLELRMSTARLPSSLPLRVVRKSRIVPMLGNPGNLGLAVLSTSRGPGSKTQPC